MHFLNTITLLATAVSAAAFCGNTAADVLNALTKLDTDTKSVTNSTTPWDGSVNGLVNIWSAFSTLESDFKPANDTTANQPPFSCTNSTNLNNFITSRLEPDTLTMTRALITKRPQFRAIGVTNSIISELRALQQDYQKYFTTYARQTTCATEKSKESAAANKINADFATAIQAFMT